MTPAINTSSLRWSLSVELVPIQSRDPLQLSQTPAVGLFFPPLSLGVTTTYRSSLGILLLLLFLLPLQNHS